jgi:hypothetical protein
VNEPPTAQSLPADLHDECPGLTAALHSHDDTTDPLRHVATLAARARPSGCAARGLPAPTEPVLVALTGPVLVALTGPVLVALTGPGGQAWSFGPLADQSVTGDAGQLCLVLAWRPHVQDTALVATGSDAQRWLEMGQAFSGPPGVGRWPADGQQAGRRTARGSV